ncbi:hypothetical protein Q3G72_028020 [Acer saccharum]|nr:hypothetical protein Q3G72_028020 [Acer saccharum]
MEERRNFGVNVESNFPKKQGMDGEMNFVFNSTRERKGISEGIKVARGSVFVDMGHRRGTCSFAIEGILDGNGHVGQNGELDRLKLQRMNLIQVGGLNPSPLPIVDQGIATNKITPQRPSMLKTPKLSLRNKVWRTNGNGELEINREAGYRDLTKVRNDCLLLKGIKLFDAMHFPDFLLVCLRNLNSWDLDFLCIIFWKVWFYRNQLVHNSSRLDLGHVVSWARDFLAEWRLAQDGVRSKLMGVVKSAIAQKIEATFSSLVAEAMALRNGILLAVSSGLTLFQIETDSLQVVNLVLRGDPSLVDVGPIIGDILNSYALLPS